MEMESAAAGFVSPHSSLSRIPPGTVSAAGTGVPVVQSSSSTIETSRSADVNVDANNVATNEGSASVDAIASTSSGSTKTGTAFQLKVIAGFVMQIYCQILTLLSQKWSTSKLTNCLRDS